MTRSVGDVSRTERIRTIIVNGGLLALIGVLLWGFANAFPYRDGTAEVSNNTPQTELAALTLATTTASFADGTEAVFRVPRGATVTEAMDGLGKARFMAFSPDGNLFVPDMVDYNLSHQGKLYVLTGFNEETGMFADKRTYLSGLRGPNSVLFYTDKDDQDWLYVALTAHLVRYPYREGDLFPSGPPEIITEFPNTQTPGETSVVWHITRTIKLHEGRIYIAVGSGCNACEQVTGDMRGMIYSILPDGTDEKVHARNIRNSVDFTWAGDMMFATANGVDHLGSRPDEVMYSVPEGTVFGWPYCLEEDGNVIADTSFSWDDPVDCTTVPRSFSAFSPRSAPLGITYFNRGSHPLLADAFLVSLHGSFDVAEQSGYELVRVNRDGKQEIFMDGFLDENGQRVARPVHALEISGSSFLLSDDHGGRILHVRLN